MSEDAKPRASRRLKGKERLNYKKLNSTGKDDLNKTSEVNKNNIAMLTSKEEEITRKDNSKDGGKDDELPHIPHTYKEAISGPNADMWIRAMQDEIKSAISLNAWDLVEKPDDVRPLDGKWVYSIKTDVNKKFIKAKAR